MTDARLHCRPPTHGGGVKVWVCRCGREHRLPDRWSHHINCDCGVRLEVHPSIPWPPVKRP